VRTGVGGAAMKRLVLGIAGGSGSGKSTVARRLTESIGEASVAFLDMDAYYRNLAHLSAEERRLVNWDHPEAFDIDLFVDHVSQLVAGMSIRKPVYDFVTHARQDRSIAIASADVIVLDGILLFVDPRVRELCDIKVFVDADADLRLLRRIRRDMRVRGRPLDEILEQYLNSVRPMHLEFVEPSKRYADLIIPVGGHNEVVIEMLGSRIQRDLRAVRA
jgi:uridine kinase